MDASAPTVDGRIDRLERSLRRLQLLTVALTLGLVGVLGTRFAPRPDQPTPELRARRLVIVDDAGQTRLSLGQDAAITQRVSRATGLILYDTNGNERGGFGTMADGSVVLGMDAPVGIGASMRDRIGLKVMPNGSAYVMLIDNQTRAVAKLHSDGAGGGGVQVFKWDTNAKRVHIRTLVFDGDVRDSVALGQ
jgi:hypothetical protein